MKPQILILTALATTITSPTFAQSEKGNGGRVWVCYKPAIDPFTGKPSLDRPEINPDTLLPVIESVQFMDYLEGNGTLTHWHTDLGKDTPGIDDVPAMLVVAVKRLETKDRWRAQKLRERLAEIEDPTKTNYVKLVAKRPEMKIIPDGKYIYSEPVTALCGEKQGAFNIARNLDMEYKYVFIEDYYNAMSDRDRAGIKLHEAIYNLEASGYDLKDPKKAANSDGSRRMVQAISSPQIENFSARRYYQWVKPYTVYPTVTALNGDYTDAGFFDDPSLEDYVLHGKLISSQTFSEGKVCREWFPLDISGQAGNLLYFGISSLSNTPQPVLSSVSEDRFTQTEPCNPISFTRVRAPWGSLPSGHLRYSISHPDVFSLGEYIGKFQLDTVLAINGNLGNYRPLEFSKYIKDQVPGIPNLNRHTLQWTGPLKMNLKNGDYAFQFSDRRVTFELNYLRSPQYSSDRGMQVQLTFHSNGSVKTAAFNASQDRWDDPHVGSGKLTLKTLDGGIKEFQFTQKGPRYVTFTGKSTLKKLSLSFDERGNLIDAKFDDLVLR